MEVDEGELVRSADLRAATTGTRETTLGGGLKYSLNIGGNNKSQCWWNIRRHYCSGGDPSLKPQISIYSEGPTYRWTLGGNRGESLWEEIDDFELDVLRFHTCLADILGFLEMFRWFFEQDIGGENEDGREKRLVMVSKEGWMS
nr:hypothetical protein [Tanacetum cinerariifolium]